MSNDLIPMGDEQAKAVQEIAKTAGIAIEAARDLGKFIGRVFGTSIEDAVGYLGGDHLHHARLRNALRLQQRTDEILRNRKVEKGEPVTLAVSIPLLTAAQDESRKELVELWARLLANAMDPARSNWVRRDCIDVVRRLEPLDAAILQRLPGEENWSPNQRDAYAQILKVSSVEIEVSYRNLHQLGCIEMQPSRAVLLPLGRLVIRACTE